jgi:hypothetical protein
MLFSIPFMLLVCASPSHALDLQKLIYEVKGLCRVVKGVVNVVR